MFSPDMHTQTPDIPTDPTTHRPDVAFPDPVEFVPVADVLHFLQERDAEITRQVVALDQVRPGAADDQASQLFWSNRVAELTGARAQLDNAARKILARRSGGHLFRSIGISQPDVDTPIEKDTD